SVGATCRYRAVVLAVCRPLRNRRGRADAHDLLRRSWQSCVVHRHADLRRTRRVLKDSHAAANRRAWLADGALETSHLRRRSIRPREARARTQVDGVRYAVVANAERALDSRVERRSRYEAVAVGTQPV